MSAECAVWVFKFTAAGWLCFTKAREGHAPKAFQGIAPVHCGKRILHLVEIGNVFPVPGVKDYQRRILRRIHSMHWYPAGQLAGVAFGVALEGAISCQELDSKTTRL